MMTSVGQKIQYLRKRLNMSQAQLANKIGVAAVTVSKWETDVSKPKGESLLRLSNVFNVGINSFINDVAPIQSRRKQVEIEFYSDVEVAAGTGCFVDEEENETCLIDEAFVDNPENTVALRVSGDSMEPVFLNGSIIFVDTSKIFISDGRPYVFVHDGLVRLKILEKYPGGIKVKSYNSAYPIEQVDTTENFIKIVGQVVAQIQKY